MLLDAQEFVMVEKQVMIKLLLTGGYFTLDDLDCIKVKFEIEKPIGDLANKINFDLLNTFFNHQHEMTRSSSINKTTMKNILNDGRDISIAKLVENTSLIIK